jgi:GNAT superfamily N-acetyltransferase
MTIEIDIRPIAGTLPEQVHSLAIEARREGYRFLDRLIEEWSDGSNRFDRHGEFLLMVFIGKAPAGIGGLTAEPKIAGALRMRRFYIHPSSRGQGIGRMLADALISRARQVTTLLAVHSGTEDASAFWQALGFHPCLGDGYSHLLRLG